MAEQRAYRDQDQELKVEIEWEQVECVAGLPICVGLGCIMYVRCTIGGRAIVRPLAKPDFHYADFNHVLVGSMYKG